MTMFCPDEERLSAWVDRGLTPPEDEVVSIHLASCEECRRAVTIAFMVDRESPAALSDEGEHRLFKTVQGALAEPSRCVSDDRLAAWLHDGLPPEERSEVTEHLAECDDCRRAAALTRLSNAEPVSALGAAEERRALDIVLRSAGRDAFFSFWRVAAASLLVAIAATYIAVQWAGPPRSSPPLASTPPGSILRPNPWPYNPRPGGSHLPPSFNSPDATEDPKRPESAPGKTAEPFVVPARYQQVPTFESEGLSMSAPGRLSYADVLRSSGVAWINVEGRALVVLDEASEARVAYAADAGAYVVEISKGCVFVDTAGAQQSWEIRRGDRVVTLRSFRGRAAAETDGKELKVHVLRGVADVGPNKVESGRAVDVRPDSSVAFEEKKDACDTLAKRYGEIRPLKGLLVLRVAGGATSDEGPWRFVSRSRVAEPLEAVGAVIPECPDPIRWIVISLDEPFKFSSDMVLTAACGGTGTKLYLWAGGSGGWHREAVRPAPGTSPEGWSLREMRRDMVPLVAGEELRKIMIGVVQERGYERTLVVDGIEIRRFLD